MVYACSTRHQTGDTDSFQLVILLPVQLDSQGTFVPCEARIVWYSAGRTSSRQLRDTTAFSLSAEIERSMISSRTKEALARKKSEGKRLGRPKGKLSSVTKLSGKDDLIREYLDKKIPVSVIARLLNVNRLTVRNYIRTRKLQKPASGKL